MERFNILLDPLPGEYAGCALDTSFRTGVQIALVAKDDELTDLEKIQVAFGLLYIKDLPRDFDTALNGIQWFMSGGKSDAEDGGEEGEEQESEWDSGGETFDFDYDSRRMYSAFMKTYGINLNRADMHWFEFLALLQDLGECAFSSVVEYRTKRLDGLSPRQRNEYARLKQKYALPKRISQEDRDMLSSFVEALKRKP